MLFWRYYENSERVPNLAVYKGGVQFSDNPLTAFSNKQIPAYLFLSLYPRIQRFTLRVY